MEWTDGRSVARERLTLPWMTDRFESVLDILEANTDRAPGQALQQLPLDETATTKNSEFFHFDFKEHGIAKGSKVYYTFTV